MKSNREEVWNDLFDIIQAYMNKLPEDTRYAPSGIPRYCLCDILPEELTTNILDNFVLIKK